MGIYDIAEDANVTDIFNRVKEFVNKADSLGSKIEIARMFAAGKDRLAQVKKRMKLNKQLKVSIEKLTL